MGTSALFFKPSEVHPCPGPELWERERETLNCEDKKSKMQRRKTKQRTEGLAHARVQRFSLCLFLDALIIFLGTGKHVPPRHTQAMINAAGPPETPFSRTTSSEVPENSHSYFFFLPPADIMLDMNLRQWNQKYRKCKPYVWMWNLERTLTKWMHVWQKHEVLVRWGHTLGEVFFFFLFNPPVCLHR